MPAPLQNAAAFAEDPAALPVVTAAMVRQAVAVLDEDPDTPHHSARVALAQQVMQDPGGHARRVAWAASTNDVIAGAWAGGDQEQAATDLQFVINGVWNAVAGIPTGEGG